LKRKITIPWWKISSSQFGIKQYGTAYDLFLPTTYMCLANTELFSDQDCFGKEIVRKKKYISLSSKQVFGLMTSGSRIKLF
jgi:hypothetical protein